MTFKEIEKFYKKDTITVAKELLGKILISKSENEIFAGYIVETEAYLGEFDRAAHGYGKKRTPKVEALFEKAGTVYIHSIHSHKMLNIVTCEKGNPQSVLIRAIEPILNVKRMEENRGKSGILVSNGPGKFTKAFGIDDRFYKTEIQIVEENMFGSSIANYRNSSEDRYVSSIFHGMYKREVFQKVGLVNEQLGRTEDNDIHYRIREHGYKIRYSPSILSYQSLGQVHVPLLLREL